MNRPKIDESLLKTETIAVRQALVVAPDENLHELLIRVLKPGSWAVQYVPTNEAALQAVKRKAFELIITSEKTSSREDIEMLTKILRERPHTRLIILPKESTTADVIAAMRDHAFSLLSKP